MTAITISQEEYDAFKLFLERACGIVLGDNKHYLLTSRLNRIMLDQEIDSFRNLMGRMDRDSRLRERILDAMTTNETSWFRDRHPYDILKDHIIPELTGQRTNPIRIWSAACSTGQEPYSISMTIQEVQQQRPGALLGTSVEIVATDISPTVLAEARAGVFDSLAIGRGLSPERRDRFFLPRKDGKSWELRPEIKQRVRFRDLNLMNSYGSLGKFDVVYCRNVLIYFSADLKRDILKRIAGVLKPRGYLFLGGSESIANYSDDFDVVRVGGGVIYRLRG